MRGARSRFPVAAAAAVLAAAALVAACSTPAPTPSSPSASASATSPTAAPSTTSASAEPTPAPSLSGAGTAPVTSPPPASGALGLLVDARLAGHEGYDRFVLEFRDAVPGYDIRYVAPPITRDPSGEEVQLGGTHALAIRLEPASGFDLTGDSGTTYSGPDRIVSDTSRVVEAVLVGDFEAVMTWVLGVDGEAPFVVTQLASPPRLVVDVDVAP